VVKRRWASDDDLVMGLRRLAVLAVAAASLAGCGGTGGVAGLGAGAPPAGAPPQSPVAVPVEANPAHPREHPFSLTLGHLRRDTARREAYERWRLAELDRARRSTSVAGALRRALLARHVGRAEHDRLRGEYRAARASLDHLSGLRRLELGAVLGGVDALAAQHRLTAGRFAPVFLLLRRNREFWTREAALPAAGHRTLFGRDPAVFQYYPGRGLQLQQLASWGRRQRTAARVP